MNGVAQIDDEILGTFRDGEELSRLKSALMRGGRIEWDVGNKDFANKIFDRIRALYPCLCNLAQFHRLLERVHIPLTTDAAQPGGDPAPPLPLLLRSRQLLVLQRRWTSVRHIRKNHFRLPMATANPQFNRLIVSQFLDFCQLSRSIFFILTLTTSFGKVNK